MTNETSPPLRRRRIVVGATIAATGFAALAFALPVIERSDPNTNESFAIAALKNISSAQAQMQASGLIDCNANDQGEYGFLGELAGAVPVRAPADGASSRCEPAVLGARFGQIRGGRVRTGGYVFEMLLPGPGGTWISETSHDRPAPPVVVPASAEVEWICYAWPVEHGRTGRRAFMITQGGDVLATNMAVELYSGDRGPLPGVAARRLVDGAWRLAANAEDARGNTWVVV